MAVRATQAANEYPETEFIDVQRALLDVYLTEALTRCELKLISTINDGLPRQGLNQPGTDRFIVQPSTESRSKQQ